MKSSKPLFVPKYKSKYNNNTNTKIPKPGEFISKTEAKTTYNLYRNARFDETKIGK